MFRNIGGTIKAASLILAIVALTIFCVCMVLMISNDFENYADYWDLIIAIAVTLMLSLIMYGFGQLVENSDRIARQIKHNSTIKTNESNTDKNKQ